MTAALEPIETLGDTAPGQFDPLGLHEPLEHPAIRLAAEACELPTLWPLWLAVVMVLTSAVSAIFPWGFA